ncbi:MAG: 3-oxoacyl-ACP synthase III [Planctomycetia bacterium]|nr:3-oxoacyl-ACP synthase III [Planctomycetia bacterium]
MKYENVCVETVVCRLPEEIVTTEEIETRLQPVYERLHLHSGRLELMTGIKERRLWPRGTRVGQQSIITARDALEKSFLEPEKIGALVHGSVCRDFLEPATACGVHAGVGLSEKCMIFDVSNACLGILTGMLQIANMIELGEIEAGIVVGTEDSRSLLETTIQQMNEDTSLTRQSIKPLFASLTIGSASAAMVLTHKNISRSKNHLLGAKVLANTRFCHLCQSDEENRMGDSMKTDSEELLIQGVDTARRLFPEFLKELGWTRESFSRYFCHQVGKAHQKLVINSLGLDPAGDFSTLEFMGNTGSAALPSALALGLQQGICEPGSCSALLGIGSGINSLMLGIRWGETEPDAR